MSGDGQGDHELRMAIADYLHQARGVNCVAEQIIIGAGNEYLELLLAQVLGEKKTVLMDDPTYLQAYRTFSNMGYLVKNIPAEQGRSRRCAGKTQISYMLCRHTSFLWEQSCL